MKYFFLLSFFCLKTTLAADSSRPDENAIFGEQKSTPDAFQSGQATENGLQMGGFFYQRVVVPSQENTALKDTGLSAPLLFDGFMDARPNDRLRAFVQGRMSFDATRSSTGTSAFQASSIANPSALISGTTVTNPQVALDQAWLKFDIARTVFVTAGRQHVRWGTARFWNPTDFLHTQLRDPLLPSDLRVGNTMIKFAVPWEKRKANLSAIILFDNPVPAANLGKVGGALRAEVALGKGEIGIEGVFRGGKDPMFGADLSTGLGPIDVFVESAIHISQPRPYYQLNTPITAGTDVSTAVSSVTLAGTLAQVAGGFTYTFGWKENRQATMGVEYFFNSVGYTDPTIYPVLILQSQFIPFYLGRNYAAFYISAEGPDSEKRTNYTLLTLGNISDGSLVTRLDFSWRILTDLTFEAFAAIHYGTRGGEFRFMLDTPSVTFAGATVPAFNVPASLFDFGMGLRMAL